MELLPRGGFRVETADYGVIEGRFNLLAKKAFCDKCFGGSLSDMLMAASKGLAIEQTAQLLLCGITNKKELGITDAFEIIEDAGGILALQEIVNHAFATETETAKKKYAAVNEVG